MSITSVDICQAADRLQGFVGYNGKSGKHIVRFSEDSFGMDVADASIIPASEFVWQPVEVEQMTLSRKLLQLLIDQNVNSRLDISEPLLVYVRRLDLPEIRAQRMLR